MKKYKYYHPVKFKNSKFRISPIHKAKTHMDVGYWYAPYIPLMVTEYPKHFEYAYNKYAEETAKQIAIDIDKDILDRIMKMTPITWKHKDTIILRKRNYVPNNKVVI